MNQKSLSSNWKRLQRQLDKNKPPKRKASTAIEDSSSAWKRNKLTSPGSSPSMPRRTQQKPTDMELWAIENDVSAADIRDAYGTFLKGSSSISATILPTDGDEINKGFSPTVEIGKYIAIDCEMVGVGRPPPDDNNALARVSLVNYHGVQIYDSFVRPQEPVVDWRTHVSGVSPRHMATARDFVTVQMDIASLLNGRILVGHAVRNDLDALKLAHPRRDTRDTTWYQGFRKLSAGRAPALKKLAREVLGVEIQGGEHSSVEDARTTMLLFRKVKDLFEAEHAKRFPGSVGQAVVRSQTQTAKSSASSGEEEGEEEKKATSKNRKKKKKRKKRTKR
ncbi:hypothetical protein FGG08_000183 [Glutinoglossum americanum]|uniref:RNA exonuclease 4 n=1 Tax=Glutinoglossum americanum TaxID=1670608 RepID=A0A9P8IDJ3_9PEZI|nr:hypothetical protein FGG08_000183 [Glutinoglossum americanum]